MKNKVDFTNQFQNSFFFFPKKFVQIFFSQSVSRGSGKPAQPLSTLPMQCPYDSLPQIGLKDRKIRVVT